MFATKQYPNGHTTVMTKKQTSDKVTVPYVYVLAEEFTTSFLVPSQTARPGVSRSTTAKYQNGAHRTWHNGKSLQKARSYGMEQG